MSVVSSGIMVVSGVTSSNLEFVGEGQLHILGEGFATRIGVSDGGKALVSSGGTLFKCSTGNGGEVKILNSGYAQNVTVADGGFLILSSGGIAHRNSIQSGGTHVAYDMTTSAEVTGGGIMHVSSGGAARYAQVQQDGVVEVWAGGQAYQPHVNGKLRANLNGAVNFGTVESGGVLEILSGGNANETSVGAGGAIHVFGGVIYMTSMFAGAEVTVSAGGSSYMANVKGGVLTLQSGASADRTTVNSGGRFELENGASASSATVNSGGRQTVLSGATATRIKENGGWVEVSDGANVSFAVNTFRDFVLENGSATVHSGTTAVDVSAGTGGLLAVFSGGTATGIMENGGWVEAADGANVSFAANTISGLSLEEGKPATVHSGTTATDFEVKSGGTMHVYEGGLLAGTMTLAEGAAVSVEEGGIVAFDLTQTSAGAAALLNDISVIQGAPLYTLTVDADLSLGTYRYALAGGAAAFDSVISVWSEDGEDAGTISVGETLFIGSTSYLLGILDSVLTLTAVVPDLTPPVVSDVQASTMAPTNEDVIVTAAFSDNYALAASLYRIDDGEWLEYADGVTVTDNSTVSFKAVDTSGNESEIVSFEVTNIDRTAPVIVLTGDNQTPAYEASLTATTEAGLDIFYSADQTNWTKYDGAITVKAKGTYSFRTTDAAGNPGTAEIVFANILSVAPENLTGTRDRVSWNPNGAAKYVLEYSTDDFKHVLRIATPATAADMRGLPAGTYQWRVRSDNRVEWAVGENILSDGGGAAPKVLESNGDGKGDIFFAETAGTWGEEGYFALAQHVGSVNDWNGTNEVVFIEGKGRIRNLFFGSSDPNILCLTDGDNGDVLFLDDVFTELPENIAEHQARIANINEIRAGAGADIIDLTSQRFEYTGDGMIVRGGAGEDVIWANRGNNYLFGDEGGDRIVGASGRDIIAGGAGDDSMHGGGGNDIFTFCENWGSDIIRQSASGTVTLWFASGSDLNWDADTLTYTDGENSVQVFGVSDDNITLKFGNDKSDEYKTLSALGAFEAFSSQRIFEENGAGHLASL